MQVDPRFSTICNYIVVYGWCIESVHRDGPSSQVSGWDLHCARLAHSLDRMGTACPALQRSGCPSAIELDADAVARLVAPTVQAAASRLDSSSALWKVAILLFPRGTGVLHIAQHMLLKVCDPTDLWERCLGEDTAQQEPVSSAVHVSPMSSAALPPVTLGVSGPPRVMPDAKDSQWAVDRVPLEQQLPEGATEGLLCTPDGRALEAFVSNFFVVVGESLESLAIPASSCSRVEFYCGKCANPDRDGKLVVQTASVEDGILEGIMRHFVMQVNVHTCAQFIRHFRRGSMQHVLAMLYLLCDS